MLAKAYKIETERLIIRCYQPKDAVLLKKSVDESIYHLLPWMPWAKHTPEPLQTSIEKVRRWRGQFDLGEDYIFGIFNKEESVLIGSTGLHTRLGKGAREIGYWLNVNYLKKGYALEAVKALTKVGFDIEQLERIEIRCTLDNVQSQNIPERLGYLDEGVLVDGVTNAYGTTKNVMIWTMYKNEYEASALKSFPLKAFTIVDKPIKI